jgi:hypothetical protein
VKDLWEMRLRDDNRSQAIEKNGNPYVSEAKAIRESEIED